MSVATRKEQEKAQRRNAILTSAKELFYEKGFQNTTVEQIAEAAELSKGTVYLYFGSKDELYVTVVLESIQIVEKTLHGIMDSGSAIREKGKALFLAFAEHCMSNREYFHMTQYFLTDSARRNLPRELIERVSSHMGQLLEFVAGLVEEGQNAGLIRADVDPYMFALIAWRTATGLLDLAVVGDSTGSSAGPYPDLFEHAIEILIDGVRPQ